MSVAGREPCLVSVTYSRNDLEVAEQRLDGLYRNDDLLSVSSGNAYNRVEVTLAVADRAGVRRILDRVPNPSIIRIVGSGVILAGT